MRHRGHPSAAGRGIFAGWIMACIPRSPGGNEQGPGMTGTLFRYRMPSHSQGVLDPLVGDLYAAVDALGVDPQKHVHPVPRAFGYLWS